MNDSRLDDIGDWCGDYLGDMKVPSAMGEDSDDMFGPPRTYPSGYSPPKTRPSMISQKYRQKEERRKVLKISQSKMKKLEDPETNLWKSVLINNTYLRLQKEQRDEKMQKQQLNYPRSYDNDNFLNLKSEFIKNELKGSQNFEEPQDFTSDSKMMDSLKVDFALDSDFVKMDEDMGAIKNESDKNMDVLKDLVEENLNNLGENFDSVANGGLNVGSLTDSSRRKSFDDMEDCDVHAVFSQFYMPPTPCMLTTIDDDEDVNVVDDEPLPKRPKLDKLVIESPNHLESSLMDTTTFDPARTMEIIIGKDCDRKEDEFRMNTFINNNIPETDSRFRYLSAAQNLDSDANPFSCGQASMFGDLQSNVFHNLIASLET